MRLEAHRKPRVDGCSVAVHELFFERLAQLCQLFLGEGFADDLPQPLELGHVRIEHRRDARELDLALAGDAAVESPQKRLLQDRWVRLALGLDLGGRLLARAHRPRARSAPEASTYVNCQRRAACMMRRTIAR